MQHTMKHNACTRGHDTPAFHFSALVVSYGQVKSLELRLEASEAQAAEAKRVAAEELTRRVSAHERDRVALEAAVSVAEEGE